MKRLVLLILLAGGFCGLQAQQIKSFTPTDSLLNKLNRGFNIKPGNSFKFHMPQGNNNANLNALVANLGNNEDHMPVAVLEGNSKMPVKKIGGYYTMPVKRIGSEDLTPVDRNALPGMPTLKIP